MPPPPELESRLSRAAGLPNGVLLHNDWRKLLASSGLHELVAEEYPVTFRDEARNQYGRIGVSDYLRASGRFFKVLANPQYRAIYRTALDRAPKEYFHYIGYGVYVGVKQ
jgi:hypothetical protein